jgi:hypothetical protein
MEFVNPFDTPGRWYKGNLHTHTTESDGRRSAEAAARLYRDAGYDFLAITDHGKVTDVGDRGPDGLLVLLGVEFGGDQSEMGDSYHITGLGLSESGEFPRGLTVPAAIEWIRAHGGEAVVAHPYWSGLVVSDFAKCGGALGLEVFNTTCQLLLGKGCSSVIWDDLLARGHRAWGLAVDDCHGDADATTARVMVRARELSREAIMGALGSGLFYSSCGPEFEGISLAGDVVTVRTSPVVEVNFIGPGWRGEQAAAAPGESLTEASYSMGEHEGYLRVECRDAAGRYAWSNPIVFR